MCLARRRPIIVAEVLRLRSSDKVALGGTRYFSPLQHAFRYGVVRPRPDAPAPTPPPRALDASSMVAEATVTLRQRVARWGVAGLQYAVVAGVLGFKFFEWWYSPAVQELAQASSEEAAAPPPPAPVAGAPPAVPADTGSVMCGLCRDVCTNMAACPSGFVYCYTCLFAHVKAHGCTPRGQLPCTTSQIRKVWVS